MILTNVELFWAKLDPSNPDNGFSGDKPQWNVQLRTRSKDQVKEWKEIGLNVITDDDEEGIVYRVNVRKDALKKDGSANKPVPVVGSDLMPVEDVTAIGNGTTANVKLRTFEWKFNGKEGVGVRLDAIQVVKMKEYAKANDNGLGFKVLEVPVESNQDDDDLY